MTAALLAAGRRVRFRAPGASMLPTIRPGEAITCEPVTPAAVRPGDILLCRRGAGVVAHRLVRVLPAPDGSRAFILRGDDLQADDPPLGVGSLLGRVVAVEREGRSHLLSGLRARLGWALRRRARRLRRRLRGR